MRTTTTSASSDSIISPSTRRVETLGWVVPSPRDSGYFVRVPTAEAVGFRMPSRGAGLGSAADADP